MAKSLKRGRKAPRPAAKAKKRRAKPDAVAANSGDYGSFDDCVHACWLKDGRHMALLEPLIFHQTQGQRIWTAPVGTYTDGASIPLIFWSVIGGPYEGKYRDAAVNHDYECCVQQNAWQDVHRMFYDGMMARGVEFWRAKRMYFAVYFFGPRWPKPAAPPKRGFIEGDVARAADLFQDEPDVTLEDIEQLTPAKLRTQSTRIPAHIEGAKLLDDTRKIRAVTREGPCIVSECK
jgi:hypothetical protein